MALKLNLGGNWAAGTPQTAKHVDSIVNKITPKFQSRQLRSHRPSPAGRNVFLFDGDYTSEGSPMVKGGRDILLTDLDFFESEIQKLKEEL